MSDLFRLTKASLLTSATDLTSQKLNQGLHDFLERTAPGFKFFTTWLKLDIATILVLITLGGELPRALTSIQKLGTQLYWWITRFFTASISIGSNDKLNREVLNWLGAHVLTRQGTRILTARTEVIQNEAWYYRKPIERDDLHHEKRVPVQYLPTFGTTWFVYEGGFFMVRRVSNVRAGSAYTGVPDEYSAAPEGNEPLVVMRLGRAIQPVKDFLNNCRLFADKQREAFITVRATKNQYNHQNWDTTILRPIRPLETVHFDDKTKRELIDDIETYLNQNTRKFYTERGIPYRRGYLFYGPPGTGKTSLSLALASYFNLELYLLHIPSIREDNDLENLFTALPPKCIILLEDIDAIGIQRRKKFDPDDSSSDDGDSSDGSSTRPFERCRCTLSGLLNVLDGVASQEGRIVLMTSNVAHKLDRALVRPGRIDRMIYLGNISKGSAKGMFERMYRPHLSTETAATDKGGEALREQNLAFNKLAEGFSCQVPNNVFTPAQLQGFLLNYRNAPEMAVKSIAGWIVEEKAAMDEAQRRKKAASERKAKKKKALKMKALKALASDSDSEGAKEEADAKEIKKAKRAVEKKAEGASDNSQKLPVGAKEGGKSLEEAESQVKGKESHFVALNTPVLTSHQRSLKPNLVFLIALKDVGQFELIKSRLSLLFYIMLSPLISTLAGPILLLGALPSVIAELDISSPNSIKESSRSLAKDLMTFYKGDEPGNTPGILSWSSEDKNGYWWYLSGSFFATYLDYWHLTGDDSYAATISKALQFQVGPNNDYMPPNQTANLGNEDQCFWGTAALLAAEYGFPEMDGKPKWIDLAENVWRTQASPDRYDDTCNGGLRWQISASNAGYDWKHSAAFMYNITNGSDVWRDRALGLSDTLLEDFFPKGILFEAACEGNKGRCPTDALFYKGFVHRWLSSATQLAPFLADKWLPVLKTSAAAAVKQCVAGTSEVSNRCGFYWSTGTFVDPQTADKTTGLGEGLSVLAAVSNLLITDSKAPIVEASGSDGSSGNSPSSTAAGSLPASTPTSTTRPKSGVGHLCVHLNMSFVLGSLVVLALNL
ncbi:hypothetical protein CORC01_12146 [Colletotrichum orchidophilum]|uniref:mannan endo-1,6-alpha-mannosidase n=1 Tax=Colletotrichum orchidophilum TaxID=1209926 RepID=A0A1G4ATS6_9PEZI|nr:uncharacterized protein CORC01_12146 [Colletotrichum orchidophilum]OHE92567.1 hypothetical protein CORC01_12146 [Colletotrichum orchidophilum]